MAAFAPRASRHDCLRKIRGEQHHTKPREVAALPFGRRSRSMVLRYRWKARLSAGFSLWRFREESEPTAAEEF